MADVVLPDVLPTMSQDVSPLRAFWDAFKENRGAVAGLFVVLLIVLIAVRPHRRDANGIAELLVRPIWRNHVSEDGDQHDQ